MSIIIDPKWTFIEALKAAWDAYPGGVQLGAPNRVRSLERWANVVGRERATYELTQLLTQYKNFQEASEAFGMSVSTLRRIRKNFEAMPIVTPFSADFSSVDQQVGLLAEDEDNTKIIEQSLKQFLELIKNAEINIASGINEETLRQFLVISQRAGVNVIAKLVDWIATTAKVEEVVTALVNLEYNDLQKLNAFVGLTNLKNVLSIWEDNKLNNEEEFWQKTLAQHSFIFAQIFALPIVVIKQKAYVGGKSISNSGGNFIDFLCNNPLTKNAALIEIKTPTTKLLGSKYRGDVYNVSSELSGSVIQIINYKNSLLHNYTNIINFDDDRFNAFNPKSIVIIGNVQNELKEQQKKKSFELFRMSLNDVQVITYDELFGKIEFLVNLLEGAIITE